MRGKRSKQYKKLMQQYSHFGFREPYQVVLDADIIRDAARFKMDFLGGLGRCLHGEVKPMITQCSIRHLYASEPKDSVVLEHAKAFERRRCNHHTLEQPLSELECLSSVIDPKGSKMNKHRLVVASQDDSVRAFMRKIPGVPLIYIKRSVMIMEPMSGATEEVRNKEERLKFRAGLKGRVGSGRGLKRGRGDGDENLSGVESAAEENNTTSGTRPQDSSSEPVKKKRKRGPSQPNPLSIRKAKKPETPSIKKSKEAETPNEEKSEEPSISKENNRAEPRMSNSETLTHYATEPSKLEIAESGLSLISKPKRKRKHKSTKEEDTVTQTATTHSPET